MGQRTAASYRFTTFSQEVDKLEDRQQITKSSQHLAPSWYDGIVCKWVMCVFCVLVCVSVFSFCCVDAQATKEHSEENQLGHCFKRLSMIQLSQRLMRLCLSLCSRQWRTANTSISLLPHCPLTFAFSVWSLLNWSQIWRLLPVGSPASFLTSFCFSMDVQGDYDPCDASGFIRINAVRLAFALKPKSDCLLKPAHTYASSFFVYFSATG